MKPIKYIVLLVVMLVAFGICGCNMQIVDTTWHFQTAHIRGISTSNEWTTVKISSWKDYPEGDVVQVKTKSGKTYLTHYANIILEAE